jgi:hypothetical protein
MDDDVEPPAVVSYPSHELADLGRLGQIARKLGSVTVLSWLRSGREIDAQNLRSGGEEELHDRGTDASPSAGHQGDLPFQRDE